MSTELFLLGASEDALGALASILAGLPNPMPVPVVVVIPRSVGDDAYECLARQAAVPIEEPDDKDEIRPGHIYVAPAGYHLLVDRGSFVLSREPPIEEQRPALTPLFESAGDAYGSSVAGLVMTGCPSGAPWESVAALQAYGGVSAIGWVKPEPPCERGDLPVLDETSIESWILRFCAPVSAGTPG